MALAWLAALASSAPARADAPASDEVDVTSRDDGAVEGGEGGEDEASARGEAPERQPGAIVYRLERIEITGNTSTADHVILRHVAVREGQSLDVDDERLEQTRYQLLGTGYFAGVRLSLERGSRRGWVVLHIEVGERSTFQVDNLVFGFAEGLASTYERAEVPIVSYAGLSVSDSNVFGTGDSFSMTLLASEPQQGVRFRFEDPAAFASPLALSGMGFFVHGREYFGDDDVLVTPLRCPEGEPLPCEAARAAVVNYFRGGGSLGTGLALSSDVHLAIAYQLELVSLLSRPDAASTHRGLDVVPIDFLIQDGISAVSMLDVNLVYDGRDSPALTRSGSLLYLRVDLASRLFGSDYDFIRAEGLARAWFPLPGWEHTLRLSAFAGVAFNQAPFFYRFYASDLSDLIPSRMLELNLDRRGPLNVFRNAIAEHRFGQLGARFDLEYQVRLFHAQGERASARSPELELHHRSSPGGDFSLWIYANLGLYALTDLEDLERPISGYRGLSLAPVDLTFDVGLRLDTAVGVFHIGFSTLLGFVSVG